MYSSFRNDQEHKMKSEWGIEQENGHLTQIALQKSVGRKIENIRQLENLEDDQDWEGNWLVTKVKVKNNREK